MKRFLAPLLIVVLLSGLCACTRAGEDAGAAPVTGETVPVTAEPVDAPGTPVNKSDLIAPPPAPSPTPVGYIPVPRDPTLEPDAQSPTPNAGG